MILEFAGAQYCRGQWSTSRRPLTMNAERSRKQILGVPLTVREKRGVQNIRIQKSGPRKFEIEFVAPNRLAMETRDPPFVSAPTIQ